MRRHIVRRPATWVTAVALAAGITVAGCSSSSSSSSSSSPSAAGSSGGTTGATAQKVSITSFTGSFASLSEYVADKKGFFTAHGIDPSFVNVTSGSAAMQAMLAGSANMANVAIFEALTVVSKGENVKYIVGAATGSIGELVVSKNVKLPHLSEGFPAVLQDLKGMKIGVSAAGSATDYELAYALEQAGLTPGKDVTIVPAGSLSGQLAGMESGQLAGFMSQEPETTLTTSSGAGRVAFYFYTGKRPTLLDSLITNGIATTGQYLSSNPTAVQGVHDAVAEADSYIANLTPTTAKQLAQLVSPDFPGVAVPVVAQAIQNYQKQFSGTMTEAGVNAANTLLVQNGVLKQPVAYDDVVAPQAQG
jgi:NitT/TauT family transport system substrate-binding protein